MEYVLTQRDGENLKLILISEAREELIELRDRMDDPKDTLTVADAEADVLESLIANGWQYIEPGDVGALTSAPMISEDVGFDEDDEPLIQAGGHVYAYMDYQVRSFVEDLIDDGYATFIGAEVVTR